MTRERLRQLLKRVSAGKVTVQQALEELRLLPFEDIGFARIDHHRELRTGWPEVVLCQGKTPKQVAEIVRRLSRAGSVTLATRAGPEVFEAVRAAVPGAVYREEARIVVVRRRPARPRRQHSVAVVCAGTADIPVAEEAAATAEEMGQGVARIYDAGVAGLHRLLEHREKLLSAKAIVAVAGMEGALPSVVAGLVGAPVIAVPTSVGYGASFHGLAPLLAMLNSCAPGVAVVNIDNGFGAGFLASLIARR
jgi:hypothetical protein